MSNRPKAHHDDDHEEDLHAIRKVFDELETAFVEHDAAKFDDRFTADTVFTAVNGVRFQDWQELHEYHKERLENHADGIRTWYEIEQVIFPRSDVAIVCLRQPAISQAGRRANVGTWILSKLDGQWWICAAQNTGVA
ncbi:conserved hypothetical protein [Actinopolyspora lacussalsi subsp. righensis]|uniref:DUF4440 domain-containing protein n=1 Tax=Actinopolyspora righensis TaxID=995060 RepID=A0A1I7B2R6_9ACTN|nr:SgcJ/EcaC family oxidoreductase [Actinopolyspora righensis]SFT81404.1 conserved hypothetical protein [Actinopolyspora righensis]